MRPLFKLGGKIMATIIIGSARIDENGKATGGVAGDQKQTASNDFKGEVSMQEMYKSSKGWWIFRLKNIAHANAVASAMKRACNNKNIGYDQNGRTGILKHGTNTTVKTEADCGTLVRQCIKEGTSTDVGEFYTGNQPDVLDKSGLFEERIEYISQEKTPVYDGDILVTKKKGHTVIVVSGNPRIAPAQKLYRVQTGAYSNKDNADARYKAVKNVGFDVCMVKSGGLYKVQVGAYKVKENAEKQLEIIEKAGFDACITTKGGESVQVEEYTQEEFVRDIQCATGSKVTGKANQETLENTITVSACVNYEDAVVAPIQRRLNALGYDCGEPDGDFGKNTARAVERLQRDIGARADGEITRMNKTWRFLLGML